MQPTLITRPRRLRIVGLELRNGFTHAPLILQHWVTFTVRAGSIHQPIRPEVRYGLWHRFADAAEPSYITGVAVAAGTAVPRGMVEVIVPAGRYARIRHAGHMGNVGRSYEALQEWIAARKLTHRNHGLRPEAAWNAPAFEVYDTCQPITPDYTVLIHEPVQ